MRNSNWIRTLVTTGIVLIAAIVFYFVFLNNGPAHKDMGASSTAELQAAFPDHAKPGAPLSSEYRKVAESDRLVLRLKEASLSIQVVDKRSGYTWSSEITDTEANESWKNFMASGLSLDYFEQEKPNSTRTDYVSQANKSVVFEPIENGFKAIIRLNDLKLGLDLHVKLEDDQLVVHIPQHSIVEGEKVKLGSVYVYPFLGATKAGEIDGYMFIPDGSGALIRLADNKGKFKIPYEARIYGMNEGIETSKRDMYTNPPHAVQYPVFGIVHGEGGNGLFGIVENGQYNAKILAYPNGVNTPYNWTTAQFLSRESYLQMTSRTLGGIVVFEKERNPEDMQIRYKFLNGQDASYVGMAKTYQSYLADKGVLKKMEGGSDAAIPVQVDVLGAETENGMFAQRLIPVTTAAQLEAMLADMKQNGIRNVNVVYKGWNEGGLSGTSPAPVKYEAALGSADDFARLAAAVSQQGGQLHLYSDFTAAYEGSARFSAQSDAAKKIDKSIITLPTYQKVYDTMYYLSADSTRNIVQQNKKQYADLNVSGAAVDTTGSVLFSESVDGKPSARRNTADTYMAAMKGLAETVPSVLMYSPNDYMLPYADQVLEVPMDSSQYIYVSEVVPFVQMVLKGYKDYYAPYTNFFANPQTSLLRMIETASYPSYYLTHESSYKLKFTDSNDVYTSAYADWRESMADSYRILNEALQPVRYAAIENRARLAADVVQVTYDNGIAIIINYANRDFQGEDITVPANGFQVIEVNR
ncbi:DUF5696 domain-containing protein [Paenibacillus sp. MER TA 81-3]|uniref:DUF5696 domain-containing protein n=1 Tax=Paenibacillus sp. MER TA 81-3 TaxID=2939573 RepID=UPI00203F512D|nr:DUF5696 domain-containing protein [Paenibacillus sp. MER TA 81-3]MCM3337636.1 DUF5696 domain-containing protein [Paenibacillus sp. MER TA 81-3]